MINKEKINQYILEEIANGSINEGVAFHLLKELNQKNKDKSKDIAVIGMACKFPGANSKEEYWNNLINEVCSIGEFPTQRMNDYVNFLKLNNRENTVSQYAKGGYLNEVDKFDASFFRITPREAVMMDPSQRLFLESGWEAIEDAGYGGNKLYGTKTGVFVGKDHTHESIYKYLQVEQNSIQLTGNVEGILASRIAYILNLQGPSVVIDTACSSGMVAVHSACQALRRGECDYAIAGGINISHTPNMKDDQMSMIQSNDDVIRAFDKNAKGSVWGEGVAAVLLKPLDKALNDYDNIYAVIKGSAINNDGASNGISAPNPDAQADVLCKAWEDAEIDPCAIEYIETHGTGTELGDPIEIKGLTKAFRRYTDRKQFCLIGSVKPNIGHLIGASGMASLFKVVLALKNEQLPGTINFKEPNPYIDFTNSPVAINTYKRQWSGNYLYAGVSAFGFSGTNCHIVLEKAPKVNLVKREETVELFTVSARSKEALTKLVSTYKTVLDIMDEDRVGDMCYTVNTGRGHYNYRIAFIFKDKDELCRKMESVLNHSFEDINELNDIYYGQRKIVSSKKETRLPIEITEHEKRKLSKSADDIIINQLSNTINNENGLSNLCKLYVQGADIDWELLYKTSERQKISLPSYPLERVRYWIDPQDNLLKDTDNERKLQHPLFDYWYKTDETKDVYVTNFSITKHWILQEHKIQGKATIPGVTYFEMVRFLARRYYTHGNLEFRDVIFFTPLSVDENEVMEAHTTIKKCNGYLEFTVCSRSMSDNDADWVMHAEGKVCSLLEAHMHTCDIEALKDSLSKGKVLTRQEVNQLEVSQKNAAADTQQKIFDWGPRWKNFEKIYIEEDNILIQIELPEAYHEDMKQYVLHPALLDNGANIVPFSIKEGVYLPYSYKIVRVYDNMPVKFFCHFHKRPEVKESSETITFDISFIKENGDVFMEVENYSVKRVHDDILKRGVFNAALNEKYYIISWIEESLNTFTEEAARGTMLILYNVRKNAQAIIDQMYNHGFDVIEVEFAKCYEEIDENRYSISNTKEDYEKLLSHLKKRKLTSIIHTASMIENSLDANISDFDYTQDMGVLSVYRLVKALANNVFIGQVNLVIISNYANKVTGTEEIVNPSAAALAGLGSVINDEFDNLTCNYIDIDFDTPSEYIVNEILQSKTTYYCAFRHGKRYVKQFGPADNKQFSDNKVNIKESGVYLITGGLGGIGLTIASHLASKANVKIALVSRKSLQAEEQWEHILNTTNDIKVCNIIKNIKKIRELGSEVECYSADVADESKLSTVIDCIHERYGIINGVIHCAGVAGEGFLFNKEEDQFRSVLSPKTKGTWLLHKLTKKDNVDFMVLFSSIASMLGGKGQGDYTAANAFLDAFANFYNCLDERVLSINWPAWNEVGMAVDYGVNSQDGLFAPIDTKNALNYFDHVLNSEFAQVVVGNLNFKVLASFQDKIPVRLSMSIRNILDKYIQDEQHTQTTSNINAKSNHVRLMGREDKPYNSVENKLAILWSQVLGLKEIDVYDNFHDVGGDSILATQLLKAIDKEYPGIVAITDIFAYPSIAQMAEFISKKADIEEVQIEEEPKTIHSDIAIIGISCKFPQADNVDEFWQNLLQGRNSIREYPEIRKKQFKGFYEQQDMSDKNRNSKMGFLDEIDKFDAPFFHISPREALMLEPAQRMFLETAWEAIEDSGYGGDKIRSKRVGVYAGIAFKSQYSELITEPDLLAFTGSMTGAVASRISYILNLNGPSMVIDTACSSGLVAIHEACKSLKNNECSMALAGGINVFLSPNLYNGLSEVESNTSELRPFDNNASGTIWGEGIGAILLKPLEKAIQDKDSIYAVIKGSAVNNDGASNGLTAPNPEAQTDVIINAWKDAGINPEKLSYIECHGTGTSLGDPIEIKGITDAFRKYTSKRQFCGIGSVKSNIGHSVAASGIASIIKVAMALKNEVIPPTINFTQPNSYINFKDGPVYVNDVQRQWKKGDSRRLAGVSAFGFVGTNCHLVLEEAPQMDDKKVGSLVKPQLFTISAKSMDALKRLIKRYYTYLQKEDTAELEDICYTITTGRGHYNYRIILIVNTKEELINQLLKLQQTELSSIGQSKVYYGEHKIVSVVKKVRELNEITEDEKRELTRQCNIILERLEDFEQDSDLLLNDLCKNYIKSAEIDWEKRYKHQECRKVNLPPYPFERISYWPEPKKIKLSEHLDVTMSDGKLPLIGTQLVNSIYQVIYETLFDTEKYWPLTEHKIMGQNVLPGTAFLEMALEAGMKYYNCNTLELTNVVFLNPLVVSKDEVKNVQTILKKENGYVEFTITSRKDDHTSASEEDWVIHTEGRIYKKTQDSVIKKDLDTIKNLCNEREIAVNLKGDTGLFSFGDRWQTMKKVCVGKDEFAYLELPKVFHQDLASYRIHPALLDCAVNMSAIDTNENLYLPLSYQRITVYQPLKERFYSHRKMTEVGKDKETISYDIELMDQTGEVLVEIKAYTIKKVPQSEQKLSNLLPGNINYYNTNWVPSVMGETKQSIEGSVLLFKDDMGLWKTIADTIRKNGRDVIEIEEGSSFLEVDIDRYTVNDTDDSFMKLTNAVKDRNIGQIIHMLSMVNSEDAHTTDDMEKAYRRDFFSLFHLTKVLMQNDINHTVDIVLISNYVNKVLKEDINFNPFGSMLFGLGHVIGQEYANLSCRCIDMDAKTSLENIYDEIFYRTDDFIVAYRNSKRYLKEYQEIKINPDLDHPVKIVENGIYIITGGTGSLGLEISKYLASKNKVMLILINRTPMPERESWDEIVQDETKVKVHNIINTIRQIEKYGSKVICYSADVSNETQMQLIFDRIKHTFSKINGIIHCAGVAGEGIIIRKEEKTARNVMNPKVKGMWILDKLTENEPLDFFIAFSSVISHLGGIGQSDYTAANSYLDAFGAYRNAKGKRTLVINWPAWSDTGMAINYIKPNETYLIDPISTLNAIKALDELLCSDLETCIVGHINSEFLKNTKNKNTIRFSQDTTNSTNQENRKNIPKMASHMNTEDTSIHIIGKSKSECSELELKLAGIWANVLRINEINIYESLHNMGGDSIIATMILKEIEKEYPQIVNISTIYSYPSVFQLAEYMASKCEQEHTVSYVDDEDSSDDIEKLFEKLEHGKISIEESLGYLSGRSGEDE